MLLALGVAAALVAGCISKVPPFEDRSDHNAAVVNNVLDQAIRNAIVRQHTLFDYHFVQDSATLNKLGEHDLGLLAAHYKERPGTLYVRQGDTEAEQYEARVNEIKRRLVEAGVDKERIKVVDGLPGGDGMPMTRVLMIAGLPGTSKPSKAGATRPKR
jgi:nucleotide-binding universal stress UspA family protein